MPGFVHEPKEMKQDANFLVAIDSDGCAFDTMEIKHKECFTPNIIEWWELQKISKYAREASEFVNLYSKWRGANRFPALLKVFDLLADRDEVKQRGTALPNVDSLRKWAKEEPKLGNPALIEAVKKTSDPTLKLTLMWSEAVNATIERFVRGVPPFPFVRESLQKIQGRADILVCSATPIEALVREWEEHGISKSVKCIAGQEQGSKAQHIERASRGHYAKSNILMVGDADGDLKAARANGALFYPINPGHEDASWKKFLDEALDKFLAGTYAGTYEEALIKEFQTFLPDVPPWKRK